MVELVGVVGLMHLADDDAFDPLELPGVSQLREHAVDVPGRRVHVLEEEDRTVEVDLPRRAERLAQQPQTAADERRTRAS